MTRAEVVRDEQIGEIELFLQIPKEVQDLRLDRHVESGNRLVADELGLERKRPRDRDALALTAGELMRIAVDMVNPETDLTEQLQHTLALFLPRRPIREFPTDALDLRLHGYAD